jgi:hypothetical protein
MSTLRIGRLLVLLSIVTACTTDLHAQYARQAKLVANDAAMAPYPNCICPVTPVAQGYWVALSADGNTAIVYGYGDAMTQAELPGSSFDRMAVGVNRVRN